MVIAYLVDIVFKVLNINYETFVAYNGYYTNVVDQLSLRNI